MKTVSLSIAKNTMITYLSLHLIANKTLELIYENAAECAILKWKKNKNMGKGHSPRSPHTLGAFGAKILQPRSKNVWYTFALVERNMWHMIKGNSQKVNAACRRAASKL